MPINGTDCPPSASSSPSNGCLAFNANGAGQSWPFFLELIADPLGGSIVPCSWFTAQGAGIPYWTIGNSTNDAPCAEPGTNGFGLAPSDTNLPAKGWDNWEYDSSGANHGQFVGNVQWSLVGSGPYYMNQYSIATSYNLQSNPAYLGNPLCTWAGRSEEHTS